MQRRLGSAAHDVNLPRAQRRPLVPPLSELASRYGSRNEAMVAAYETGDFTQKAIGDFFGVHFSTVGRIVRQTRKEKQRDVSGPGHATYRGLTPNFPGLPGVCAAGTFVCQDGGQVCVQDQQPGAEGPFGSPTCSDGLDNDCDGLTDEADPECAAPVADVLPSKFVISMVQVPSARPTRLKVRLISVSLPSVTASSGL